MIFYNNVVKYTLIGRKSFIGNIPRWKRSVYFNLNLSFSIRFPTSLRSTVQLQNWLSFIRRFQSKSNPRYFVATRNQNREPLFGVQQTCRVAGLKHPPQCSLRFDRGEPLARRIRCNKRPARQRGLQDDLGGSVGNTAGSFGGMKSDSTDLSFSLANVRFLSPVSHLPFPFLSLSLSFSPVSVSPPLLSLFSLHLLFLGVSTSLFHPSLYPEFHSCSIPRSPLLLFLFHSVHLVVLLPLPIIASLSFSLSLSHSLSHSHPPTPFDSAFVCPLPSVNANLCLVC